MVDVTRKVRENRLRRKAMRQGLFLSKNPRRDPNASDYGTFVLVDLASPAIVHASITPAGELLRIDDVEAVLNEEMPRLTEGTLVAHQQGIENQEDEVR